MRAIRSARRVLGALALMAAAAMADAEPAAAQGARVLGRVTDGVGNPVADARVTLVPDDTGTARHETTSGQTGGFQFGGVAAGTYTLRVARDGFPAREQRVTVREGQVVSQVVRLRAGRAAQTVAARAQGR